MMPNTELTVVPKPPSPAWSVDNLLTPNDLSALTRYTRTTGGYWDQRQVVALLQWLVETQRGEQLLIELTRMALTNKLQIFPK